MHNAVMARTATAVASGAAAALLTAVTLPACAPAAPSAPRKPAPSASGPIASTSHAGFVGWRWTVTAIANGGAAVAVPAKDGVYLQFDKNGMFVANEPVNTHSGPYQVTSDGFTTGQIATTLELGGVLDKGGQLAIQAIDSFSERPGTQATVDVTGTRMTVTENGYTFTCTRATPAPT
jgi:heat shock protein HslJ